MFQLLRNNQYKTKAVSQSTEAGEVRTDKTFQCLEWKTLYVEIFLCQGKLDRVASFVTDTPRANSTTRHKQPISDPPLNIAVNSKPIIQFLHPFLFKMSYRKVILCKTF